MGLEPGTIIGGKYSVTQRLGVGGMGEVWSGQSLADGSPVAVKIMLSAAALTREVWARFKREAQVLGRIQSDYVARVLDFVSDPQHGLALVMELIPGQPFSAVLASEGRISIEAMTLIAIDVTRGLADLHAAKIVHRDMKPGNIVLNPRPGERDRAMIIDFGVSRILSDPGEEEVTAITRDDRVLGTLEYMAPEQVLGSRTVTPVADLYAMGAMMYRAVAGRHVFGDLVEGKLVAAKLNDEAPRLETGRKDPASQRFASMVAKLLSRRPKQRIQTAEELLIELETIEELLFTPLTMPLIHVQFEEDPLPDEDDELPTAALSPEQRAQIMLRQARSMAQQRRSALEGIVAAKEISVSSGATTQRLDNEVSISVSESEISADTEKDALHPAMQQPAPLPEPARQQRSNEPSPSPATPSQGYAAAAPVESPSQQRGPISSQPERSSSEARPMAAPQQGGVRLSFGMIAIVSTLVVTAAVVGGVVGASVASRRTDTSPVAASAPMSSPASSATAAAAAPAPSPEPAAQASASAAPVASAATEVPSATPLGESTVASAQTASAAPKPKRVAYPVYAAPKPAAPAATTAAPATASPESPPAPTTAPTPSLPDQP